MTIPFYQPTIGPQEIAEVVATLRSGWLTTGPRTHRFEQEFAAYVQQKYAVALNSCTAALHLALEAIGLARGDYVLLPTMTFAATAEVVHHLGAIPLLCDCRQADLNLDLEDAERRLNQALQAGHKVRAIVPVHYAGQVGDVAGVRTLAARYGLRVVTDAAHCCPAYYRDPGLAPGPNATRGDGWWAAGTEAEVSCFSFYANKPITTGEGGMACTNSQALADRIRLMSLHGLSRDAWRRYYVGASWSYQILAPGFKCNLTDIAAAMGLHQLRRADSFHRRRTQLARAYSRQLESIDEIRTPTVQLDRIHSWHLYVIRLRLDRLRIGRDQFIAELGDRGIGTSVHWTPLHLHPYYQNAYRSSDFPVATALSQELVSLPLYPRMTEAVVIRVCKAIRQIVHKHRRLPRRIARLPAWRAPNTTLNLTLAP